MPGFLDRLFRPRQPGFGQDMEQQQMPAGMFGAPDPQMAGAQPQGMFGRAFQGLSNFNERHPALLLAAGDVLRGEDPSESVRWGMLTRATRKKEAKEEAETKRKKNMTREWLIRNRGMSAEDADAIIEAGAAGNYLKPAKGDSETGTEYGLNPIWGKDEAGNDVLGVLGKDGSFKPIDTGGFTPSRGIEKVDLGTEWGFVNKSTGELIRTEAKDLRGAEREKGIGKAQGEAAAAAPGDFQAGQTALDLAGQIRAHPALESGTGFSSKVWNWVPGSDEYDFQNLVDQAKSGAFLAAVQQMRGLGALSNAEGSAATQAITRMNTATSKEAFLKALEDYEGIVMQGMERASRTGERSDVEMPPPAVEPIKRRTSSGIEYEVDP